MARPPFQPTDDQRKLVMRMSVAGIPQDLIARCVTEGGIAPMTLRKYFAEELETAEAMANTKVAGALFKNCMSGNVAAQIFWMKSRGRWRETGPDTGAAQAPNIKIVFGADDGDDGRSEGEAAPEDREGVVREDE